MATNAFDAMALAARPRTDFVTLAPSNPLFSEATKLSHFRINGIDYVRKEEVASKIKRRLPSSKIWQSGEPIVRVSDKVELFYCYHCELARRP